MIRANWWVLESFRLPEANNVWLLHSRHDVRRLHEKFFRADSSDHMGVKVISASWAEKRLIPTFYTRCTSSSWKIFFSPIRANWWVLQSFRPPEPKNVWFPLSRHDVRRVHEKFFLAHSSELMGVRVISGSLAQKRLIPTFYTRFTSSLWKIFFRRFERTDGC